MVKFMEINAYIGGRPGYDCGGFCKFCYFRSLDPNKFRSSSPSHIKTPFYKISPADQLSNEDWERLIINELKFGFKSPYYVLNELTKDLLHAKMKGYNVANAKISIISWGDVINYPHLPFLISEINNWGFRVHIGYTGGKGLNEKKANFLINKGVKEVDFSVFSTDSAVRQEWMNDKTPEDSLDALKTFAEKIDVNTSIVVIPEVNEFENIYETCVDLEKWNVNSLVLSRFANFRNQGLILNDRPIIEGVKPHSFDEFKKIVKKIDNKFNFKVLGFPAYDPQKGIPYLLSKTRNNLYLEKLPKITSEATILTSTLSCSYLKKIFELIDQDKKVNIISVDNEIGSLICPDDLRGLDLRMIKNKVIIPGVVPLTIEEAQKILTRDGSLRVILKGPESLFFADYFDHLNENELLNYEFNAFERLINQINA